MLRLDRLILAVGETKLWAMCAGTDYNYLFLCTVWDSDEV